MLFTQRDQLDCPPPNGLNHYLPLNKTGPHSTGERFRATMALLFLLGFCARLFIDTLWSPAGIGLTSWLSFVMSSCEVVTFPLVSWVRCGA